MANWNTMANNDPTNVAVYLRRERLGDAQQEADDSNYCKHESELTPDGNGAYCRFCGETLG